MANQEHLDILKNGVKVWNAWREENRNVRPNFKDADLRKSDLSNANLSNANFFRANLTNSDLNNANLRYSFPRQANFNSCNLNNADLTRTDLSFTYLRSANLCNANLLSANLTRGKLENANLNSASLNSAHLNSAKLNFADLRNAKLNRANLLDTNLSNANLSSAVLTFAKLHSTILHGTEFNRSIFGSTLLSKLDLRKALNLEYVIHKEPSLFGIECFQISKGVIHDAFLKGVGLYDWEIEFSKLHQPNLNTTEVTNILYKMDELRNKNPIQLHNLFISYSRSDSDFVNHLEPLLLKKNIRFWRDIHDATAGPIEKILEEAIAVNKTILLVLSKTSVKSDWVEFEMKRAREKEKQIGRYVICPISLDDSWKDHKWSAVLMDQIQKYNILDFSGWKDSKILHQQFSKLVKGLDLFYRQ